MQHAYLGVSTSPRPPAAARRSATSRRAPRRSAPAPRSGDVVTEVDGKAIAKPEDIATAIADNKPGDQITMTVRRNGRERTLDVTLGDRPATAPAPQRP